MSDSVPNPHGENGVVRGAHTTDENGQSVIVQNYDPRQSNDPNVDKVALSPSDTAQNVTNLGHENQHAIDAAQGVATSEDYAKLEGAKQTDYFSFALDNYNLGEMNTGSTEQDAAYFSANRNNPTTQAGNVFADGIDPGKTDYDVLLPVNKRNSTPEDLGHWRGQYTKYDLAVLDYDTPQEFEAAIQAQGYNSVDEYRDAASQDPSIMNNKYLGQVDNMTFVASHPSLSEDKQGEEILLGSTGKWGEVYDFGVRPKEEGVAPKYSFGIIDVGSAPRDEGGVYTSSDGVTVEAARLHYGGPGASEGCVTNCTNDTTASNRYEKQNNFENTFMDSVPSVTNPNEGTFLYAPPKSK
jgi:hypothetical protein